MNCVVSAILTNKNKSADVSAHLGDQFEEGATDCRQLITLPIQALIGSGKRKIPPDRKAALG